MDYKKIYTKKYYNGKGRDSIGYLLGYGRFAKFYFRSLFRPLKPHIKRIKKGKVLDVGCAYGFMLRKFPDSFEKFGIDVSEYAIAQAQMRFFKAKFKVGNVEEAFPFPKDFFDIIICNDVIEHLSNPQAALKNMINSFYFRKIAFEHWP